MKLQLIIKELKEIAKKDRERSKNILSLRKTVKRLRGLLADLADLGDSCRACEAWLEDYAAAIDETVRRSKGVLTAELVQSLERLGLKVEGHYPSLRVGLFTIELDIEQDRASIWYGPKKEFLGKSKSGAEAVTGFIDKARKDLGSRLPEQEYLTKLVQAYERVCKIPGEPVLLKRVLPTLAFLLQDQRFYTDPRRDRFKSYTRADFSYDLFRIQRWQSKAASGKKVHLTVATRAQTARPSDYIWVPKDDKRPDGTNFAYIFIKEEAQHAGSS